MKDTNRVTGESRHTCPFYDELDAVLGTRAASSPPIVLESSGAGSSTDQYTGMVPSKERTITHDPMHTIGSNGQSNPATPGDDSDQVDGGDSITGDTVPST